VRKPLSRERYRHTVSDRHAPKLTSQQMRRIATATWLDWSCYAYGAQFAVAAIPIVLAQEWCMSGPAIKSAPARLAQRTKAYGYAEVPLASGHLRR